jgi:hypothetical protein
VETGRVEVDSRRYYRNGWRLLEQTKIAGMRMDQIIKDEVKKLQFPGSASNGNNALRTLRRMYSKAKEHKMTLEVPDFALFKEHGRSLRLNDEAERRLSAVADQPLKDHRGHARHRNAQHQRTLLHAGGERGLRCRGDVHAIGSRVKQILKARSEGRSEGRVWMSRYKGKHIGEGMVYRQWAPARQAAGLPRELVLYCARHDFGSFVLAKTGNLKAVINAMGHGDVRSAMVYQHPEGENICNALNARHISRPPCPIITRQILETNLIGPQTAFRGY